MPRSVLRDPRGQLARDIPPREILEALADPATRLWVDIDSASRHQHAILEKLFRFHPLTIEDTLNPNSRVKIEAYDGYLFVQADLGRRAHDVMWTPGVKSLVGPNGVPAPLDAQVVAFLKRNATADGHLRARSDLRRGQEVEIIAGPMAGLIAIIEDPPDAQGRIRVLMRLLNQRPIKVRMPVRAVRSGWVA